MKQITPVILVRSLNVVRGGVTKASIKRANVLAQKYKEVIIITVLYQQNHKQIIKELYNRGLLSKNVKVINFFEEMKPNKQRAKKLKSKRQYKVKEKGLVEFRVEQTKEEPSFRYYKDGLYVKYKRFNENGTLKLVDYMDADRHRIRREEFDGLGNLVRIRQMDKLINKPRLDQYFDNGTFCYLSVHVNSKSGKEGRTAQFDKPYEFDSLYSCQQAWLNTYLNNIDFPVVTCELRGLHKMLREVKHDNIRKIEVIHTNHIDKPFDDIRNIKKSYTQLFEHAKELDQVVFLTNEQKDDVEAVYGKRSNFTVIPHASEKDSQKKYKRKENIHDPKLAVTLARYHEDKRLDDAIRAFKYVVERIPEAKYHIYGYGKLKDELQLLINKLELENNVYLKSYTNNAKETYKAAACSILTSRQEGFAMVITESMAVGTPVISYDTKYGPKDIIENGIDGFLVSQGDTKKLAEKIIEVMENSELQEKLSKNAVLVSYKFSEKKYRKHWLDLIEE